MALLTRADVLEQMGLTDTTSDAVAFSVGIDDEGSVTQVVYRTSTSTLFRVQITGGDDAGTNDFDLTSSDYNTVDGLVAGINALDGAQATAVATGTDPSTPLASIAIQTLLSLDGQNKSGVFRYDGIGVISAVTSYIDTAVLAVVAAAERYLGRTLEQAAIDEKVDGGTSLIFGSPPVSSATIKYVNDSGSETTLSASEYDLDTEAGIAYPRGAGHGWGAGSAYDGELGASTPARRRVPADSFAGGIRRYRLEYTGGYATAPADLKAVLVQHAVDMVLARRDVRTHLSSAVQSANRSLRTPAEVDEQFKRDLRPWLREGLVL